MKSLFRMDELAKEFGTDFYGYKRSIKCSS